MVINCLIMPIRAYLSRLHHKKGRRQTVENVKYAVNSQLSCVTAGVQGDKKKIQKIIPHISYLKPIDT